MTSAGDISAALAYQVKKEIAENFFGTRKALEEEREDLIAQMVGLQKKWQREVLPFLERISFFLMDREAIRYFVGLIHQEACLQSLLAGTVKREDPSSVVFCSPAFAFTARGKYANLIFSLYREAEAKAGPLLQGLKGLLKRADLFNEELAAFQARFNWSDILAFIKNIENRNDLKGVLGENTDPRALPALEKTMVIKPLSFTRPGEHRLRALPPLKEIQKSLNYIINQTFQNHCPEIKKRLKAG